MKTGNDLTRRNFILNTAAAGVGFTIVPSHVLGGEGRIAPSDRINVALVGCGTVGLSLLDRVWIDRPELQFISVCDPNRESYDYPTWGKSRGEKRGRPGGREVAKQRINEYYGEKNGTGKYRSCTAYADFRELLETENDLDSVFILTPDHSHASIAVTAMRKNISVGAHKPIGNFFKEVRKTVDVAKETGVATHSFAFQDPEEYYVLKSILEKGSIGNVTELHRWTNRPVWPQGSPYLPEEKPIPEGFDWELWLGPSLPRPYSPEYTHTKFRGWYEFGAGCLADMGYYGFWKDWRLLNLGMPLVAEGSRSVFCEIKEYRSHPVENKHSYPHAATLRLDVPVRESTDMIDVYWYEGGIKPPVPKLLRREGRSLKNQGMLLVGEKGSILADYGYGNIELLDVENGKQLLETVKEPGIELIDTTNEMIDYLRGGKESRGNYQNCQDVAEAIALGNLAIRTNRRLEWDNESMIVTNFKDANSYTDRKWRPGWEL